MEVTVYCDGACSGNPGVGGWGAVLIYVDPKGKEHRKELGGTLPSATNQRAELVAAIKALEAIKKPCQVVIHSDSEYLVRGAREWMWGWAGMGWRTSQGKPVANRDLWERLMELHARFPQVAYVHVPGHRGHPDQERVNEIAQVNAQAGRAMKGGAMA